MRGQREHSCSLFSYVSIKERIPASHPLRRIRKLADQALDRLHPTFSELYASEGHPFVLPEQLLLASLLQAFDGIRSERLLLEQLRYNLFFRWFVGLSPDDPIGHTTYNQNRERLLHEQIMECFLEKRMAAPEVQSLLSDEYFSVDGTLLQAWASHACLERIDEQDDPPPPPSGPGEGFGAPKDGKHRAKGDFRCINLCNTTNRSRTDTDALLARKSNARSAQPSYRGHGLMDNRHAPDRCDASRGPKHSPPWWFCDRWAHHSPRGLRQVDQRPPRHREVVRAPLDCVYGWIKQWGGLKLRSAEEVSAVFGLDQ